MADSRSTILLVETDPALRDLIVLPLEREGYAVISTSQPPEISNLVRKYRPFLLILDMFLPQISGLDVIRKIGENLKARCYIFLISSLGFKEVVEQAKAAGVRDFLLKPIDTDRMLEKVRSAHAAARYLEPWD